MIPQKLIDRTEFLRRRMKELCGVDALEDTRLGPVVYCRVLIVQVLVNDGWSDAEIGEAQVDVMNALGVIVESRRAPSLQAPNAPGVYTLRITVEGKGICYRRLVVE